MLRVAVFVLALVGLTVLAAGVIDAVPLVFWSTAEERASIEHGRTVMLIGAALTLVAAVAVAALGRRRAAALVAFAPLLPVGLALAADGTAFGLLALPIALGAGLAGAIALFAGRAVAG
jgi:hypothetical protein